MRLHAQFRPGPSPLHIPVHYNHLVQGLIYSSLSPGMAEFVHTRGFSHENRTFRLFTFSRLIGPFRRDGDHLVFPGPLHLWVSSPIGPIVEELASAWLHIGSLQLGESKMAVEAVELKPTPELGNSVVVRTLSPVTAYETLHAADGRAKTYYYAPAEREFCLLCAANARRKLLAMGGQVDESGPLAVEPAGWQRHRQAILSYKGTVVKAWHGAFRLSGQPELLHVILDAGLGSKSAQGFGMVEIWEGGR